MDCGSCEEIIGRILAMLLTVFLTIVFCVAITLMMFSAVAFIQDKKCFQFFFRFVFIFTVYKIYDMICFDYFLLIKYHFFQFYFPEVESVYSNRKYGYNIKSQLLKLLVIFPAVSALAAWICSLI